MKITSCRRKYFLEYFLGVSCIGIVAYFESLYSLPLAGVCFWYAELMRLRTHIKFDENKISVVDGILSKKVHAIYLENVSDITVRQGLWQRMVGYGSIVLRSNSGTENLIFPAVRKPYDVVKVLEARIESNKR